MTWVKVCGLTRGEDVAAAVAAGADAVGFVAIAASPRYLPLAAIAELTAGVPITRVLLTVDLEWASARRALEASGANAIQPYGRHVGQTARRAGAAGFLVLRPCRVTGAVDLPPPAQGIPLLDAAEPRRLGGTGRSFDWSLVAGIERDFVLAGGLGPGNVAGAVAAVGPWGVDASSGLESAPGVKDHGRVADFVSEAKKQ